MIAFYFPAGLCLLFGSCFARRPRKSYNFPAGSVDGSRRLGTLVI
jgi:hypothetical protein